jgi:acylphosphatase
VEAVFEGPRSEVQKVVVWCHHGPRMAQVDAVDLEWEEPTGEFTGFSVRH